MAAILGVITNQAQALLAQAHAGHGSLPTVAYWKVGQGGFKITGGVRSPILALPSQTYLDILENPTNYNTNAYNLINGYGDLGYAPTYGGVGITDLTWGTNLFFIAGTSTTPPMLQINALLDFGVYNSSGGLSPQIWEIGVYDNATPTNNLIGYATFPMETKTSDAQILNTVLFGY